MKLTWRFPAEDGDKVPMRGWAVLELFNGGVRFGLGIPRVDRQHYALTLVPFVMVRPSRFGW